MLDAIRNRLIATFLVVVLLPLLVTALYAKIITSQVIRRGTLESTILSLTLLVLMLVLLAKPLLLSLAEGFNIRLMSLIVRSQSQFEAGKHVRERTAELAALLEISTEISSQLDLNRVLNLVVDKAHTLLGGDIVVLCLLDEAGESLTMAAASGSNEALIGCHQSISYGIGAYVVGARQTAYGSPKNCDCRLLCPNFRRDYVTAPLRVGERIMGALCINDRQAKRFSNDEARLLTLLANAAAVAVENARLYEQAQQAAALAERERLAADIHDGFAQTLGFFKIKVAKIRELIENREQAQAQKELARMSDVIAESYNQVRGLIVDLHQPTTSRNLTWHLAEQIAAFEREQPICFTKIEADEPDVILSSAATDEVMRIVGEAINNARKHAEAARIEVGLQRDLLKRAVLVTIEDDGRGFEPQTAASEEQGHFGLGLMRARAERAGGKLQIDSSLGQGTRVTLHWPLD